MKKSKSFSNKQQTKLLPFEKSLTGKCQLYVGGSSQLAVSRRLLSALSHTVHIGGGKKLTEKKACFKRNNSFLLPSIRLVVSLLITAGQPVYILLLMGHFFIRAVL